MLRNLITATAAQAPDAVALLSPEKAALSYARLDAMVRQTAESLALLGIDRTARVGLVCSSGPQMATAFLGIAAAAACAPLNPAYRANEFEFYLSDLQLRAIVIESGLDSPVRAAAGALKIPIFELAQGSAAGDIRISGASAGERRAVTEPAADDVALLLHTSGTTSRPKLVPLTHANLCASAEHIAKSLELTAADRCLNVMPLFHIHGLAAAVLASLARGASVVCCPGFVAPKFFDWVAEFEPTWYTAVPTIHHSVLARAESHRAAVARHRFRFIRSCSSPLAPSLMQAMESTFQAPVIEAYGMTEAAHQMASNPLPPGRRKPGSVGAAAGPEVAVMNEDGDLLPRGAKGEIVIRGPNVTAGYAANPEANRSSFHSGWFRTGDEGFLDEDGYLFLSGRRKEMINRGGEKIAPREIDEALLQHPAVSQAVAFAAPHAVLGETVAAAVILKAGQSATVRELREFAAARLADFKVPERVLFVDELPKGASGKLQRIGLAAKLGVDAVPPPQAPRIEYAAPRSKIEKQIALAFAESLRVARVGLDDHFFDLGGDSLMTAALLTRIVEISGVELSVVAFLENPTVAGVCANLAAAERGVPASGGSKTQVVVRAGPGPILFCFPVSSNELLGFFHLARRLGPSQPVTAFRYPDRVDCEVEGLARRYVAEILRAQPEGPYCVAGMCTGGFIAYEAARQLSEQGRTVGLLALLDCYNHDWGTRLTMRARTGYRLDLLRRRFQFQRERLARRGPEAPPGYLKRKIDLALEVNRQRWKERLRSWRRTAGFAVGAADPTTEIREAGLRYAPGPFDGRLELLYAEAPRVGGYAYPDMGWRGLAQHGAGLHRIPGDHQNMLAEPHVQIVADTLGALLNPFAAAVPWVRK